MDVFENYDFVEAKAEQPFSITEINASVEWTDGVEGEDGSITFTYEYNGKAHYPAATAKKFVRLPSTPFQVTLTVRA